MLFTLHSADDTVPRDATISMVLQTAGIGATLPVGIFRRRARDLLLRDAGRYASIRNRYPASGRDSITHAPKPHKPFDNLHRRQSPVPGVIGVQLATLVGPP